MTTLEKLMTAAAIICILGITASGALVAKSVVVGAKDQSVHPKAVATCNPEMSIIPYELRGFYHRYRPEQRI